MKKTRHDEDDGLRDRLEEGYKDKDKGGAGASAFDWKKVKDVKFYKMTKGGHRFNIIPFVIKSKNHPRVRAGTTEIGKLDYGFDVWIHKYVGGYNHLLCLKKTFNRSCPACELQAELEKKGKVEEAGKLKSKRTVLYNVIDADDEDEGIQVFEVAHFLFEKELIEAAKETSDNGELINFANVRNGKIVAFRASPAKYEGGSYFKFKNFTFEDRDERLPKDVVDDAISFDELLHIPTKEETEKILYGDDEDSDDDDEDDDGKKKRKSKRSKSDDDDDDEDSESDDDDEDDDEDDDSEEDEDEEEDSESDDEDDDEDEDDDSEDDDEDSEESDDDEDGEDEDEDTPPSPRNKKRAPKSREDDEEGDDEEDADEPKGKGKKATSSKVEDNSCPEGFEFGKDCENHPECKDCDCWAECLGESRRLAKSSTPTKKPARSSRVAKTAKPAPAKSKVPAKSTKAPPKKAPAKGAKWTPPKKAPKAKK